MVRVVGVVLKPGHQEAYQHFLVLARSAPSVRFIVESAGHHALAQIPPGVAAVDDEAFQRDCELVVVLGGDGTLIHAASLFQKRAVPILGVNLGRVGFLTDVSPDELLQVFPKALAGELVVHERLRLWAEHRRDGKTLLRRAVLNDAVLSQISLARIVTYRVTRGEELITILRGDGVIVSTPTGSTAYALAAGGGIVSPDVAAIAITPVCPQGLSQRQLVLAPSSEVQVSLESESTVSVTLDGQVGGDFKKGDVLSLRKADVPALLLGMPNRSYFHTLRSKLRWGEGH